MVGSESGIVSRVERQVYLQILVSVTCRNKKIEDIIFKYVFDVVGNNGRYR